MQKNEHFSAFSKITNFQTDLAQRVRKIFTLEKVVEIAQDLKFHLMGRGFMCDS